MQVVDIQARVKAEQLKIRGNQRLKDGVAGRSVTLLREAVQLYGQGVDQQCGDDKLNSVLLSNRSHVHSLLGDWHDSLEDSYDALALDRNSLKACFRAARAALKLRMYPLCLEACATGLAMETDEAAPPNADFLNFQQAAHEGIAKKQEDDQRRTATLGGRDTQHAALIDALEQRGVRMRLPPIPASEWQRSRPWLDGAGGAVHWPVTFGFPEMLLADGWGLGHCDEDVSENAKLADILDAMFVPNSAPLVWDQDGAYTRERVEVYYMANAAKPLKKAELLASWQDGRPDDLAPAAFNTRWARAPEECTLGQLLARPDHILVGAPSLVIVANATAFRHQWLAMQG